MSPMGGCSIIKTCSHAIHFGRECVITFAVGVAARRELFAVIFTIPVPNVVIPLTKLLSWGSFHAA